MTVKRWCHYCGQRVPLSKFTQTTTKSTQRRCDDCLKPKEASQRVTLKPGYIVVHDGQKYLVQSAQNITIERKDDGTNTLKTITIGVPIQHDATKRRGLRAY